MSTDGRFRPGAVPSYVASEYTPEGPPADEDIPRGGTEERFCSSLLPVYSERSARSKLERHRKRGDPLHTAFHCPWADHWHVIEGTLEERAEADQ